MENIGGFTDIGRTRSTMFTLYLILEHLSVDLSPTCEFSPDKIKVLDTCRGDLQLRYAESIHLKHSKQTLNTQERSIPLKWFEHVLILCIFNMSVYCIMI